MKKLWPEPSAAEMERRFPVATKIMALTVKHLKESE